MKKILRSSNPGQIIILCAFGLLVLSAVAVLALDGGMTFLNRRAAQAAADAGALAGARVKCKGGTQLATTSAAEDYAKVQNGATSATASVANFPDGDVVVEASIKQNTFFAQIFGINQLDIKASASANCFPPASVKGVMPIAWFCKDPPAGGAAGDNVNCVIKQLNWKDEMVPLIAANNSGVTTGRVKIHGVWVDFPFNFRINKTDQIYIIMDSQGLRCDLDVNCDFIGQDGLPDVAGSGDRGWILLQENCNGTPCLTQWFANGFSNPLSIHTWLGGKTGVSNDVFHEADTSVRVPQKVLLLPIYDHFCPGDPRTTVPLCLSTQQDPGRPPAGDAIVDSGPGSYFHIIGFAPFFVTCVYDGGQSECPAHKAAVIKGIYGNSVKSIEGYFVSDYPWPTTGFGGVGEVEIGITVQSLTK